jgi:VIT1/CCC1 family predicted Fe2+/Mn2+ transporter
MSVHTETHFTGSATVRDIVIGATDGLTVPFALAAGLSGVVQDHWLVVVAGAAEVAAGTIAMGLGGYLAVRSDIESYESEYAREWRETHELEAVEKNEVREIFAGYGLIEPGLSQAVEAVTVNRDGWVRFMMREELGREKPEPGRAVSSARNIGAAYALGGLVPLFPYCFPLAVPTALLISAAVTLLALALFGYTKGRIMGVNAVRSALQTSLVGGAAAGAAYLCARLISGAGH